MRLLSWNIHKGIGGRDRRYSLDRIITCIEAENPDLICLQDLQTLTSMDHIRIGLPLNLFLLILQMI